MSIGYFRSLDDESRADRRFVPRRPHAAVPVLAVLASLLISPGPSRPAVAAPGSIPERDECSIESENCVAINFQRRRRFGPKAKQQDCANCVTRCRKEQAWPFSLCPNR